MLSTSTLTVLLTITLATATATTFSITPHTQYSSSIGVLGCKVNTNRVAFFPTPPSCDDLCVRVTHPSGRSLTLLHIDQSGGAHDISYDAYNFLVSGNFLNPGPAITGGGVNMDVVPLSGNDSACRDLMSKAGGRLAFSATNSMNFVTGCMTGTPGGFVAENFELFNIANPTCTFGVDEVCMFTKEMLAQGLNQPACPSGLGVMPKLTTDPVFNFMFGTNVLVVAP